MPPIEGLFHKRLAVANLANGVIALNAWREALTGAAENMVPGGAAAAVLLSGIYSDALILAAGPLTGTMTPGSSLLVASVPVNPPFLKGGRGDLAPNSKLAFTPFLLRHGLAFKAAGVDFAVITGTAAEPSILTIAEGRSRIEPAGKLADLDMPGLRKAFRARMPESRYSLILCGPAARRGASLASAGVEAGTSLDRGPLAAWMANHNLIAVVLAGGGALPGAGYGSALFKSMGPGATPGGFLDVLSQAEGGTAAGSAAGKILGRAAACHLCPRPCMAYLRPAIGPEGLLCMDHNGFAAMSKACPAALPQALQECARLGLEPVAVSSFLHGMTPDWIVQGFESLLAAKTGQQPDSRATSASIPVWSYPEAMERISAGMVLGICPILLQRFPDIPLDKWVDGLDAGAGTVPLRERLDASIKMVCPV